MSGKLTRSDRLLTRKEFCALRGISYSNLDNLTRAGQLALALGLTTPAVFGEYHRLDVFANALADTLVERGFPRETAALIVREHHQTWLLGLIRTEWEVRMVGSDARGERIWERQIYFVVARTERGKGEVFRAAVGLPEEALKDLRQVEPATDMVFVNLHDVLDAVRAAFHVNHLLEEFVGGRGANLPLFTRDPNRKAEFDAWREEIRRYQAQSIGRLKTRERTHQGRRKKQPARKQQLLTT